MGADGATASNEAAGPGRDLCAEMERAFKARTAPNLAVGSPMGWIKAIDDLLIFGDVDVASHTLRHLREHEPDLRWPQNVLDLIGLMPEEAVTGARFADDRDSDVQVIERPGARTVVMVFCGRRHRPGMPIWLFQRWMASLDASVVYLRDFADTHYVGGVRSLGSREQTLAALSGIAGRLGAERIFCVGNSSGGFAALDYGLELGAEGVLSFSGATNLEPDFNAFLNRADVAVALRRDFPQATLDLREACMAASRPPRTILVYGDQCWDDRLHNEHMAGAPGVELAPLEDFPGHGSLPELIRRGRFGAVMDDLVSPAGGRSPAA